MINNNGEKLQNDGMMCEEPNCNRTHGADYKRKNAPKVWKDVPIYLCEEHAKGYELYEDK